MKSQFRNHEALVKKLLEDAREPHYRGFCIGNIYIFIYTYISICHISDVLYRYRFTIECTKAKSKSVILTSIHLFL